MAENSSDVKLSDLVAAKTAGWLVVWSGLTSGLTPPPPDEKVSRDVDVMQFKVQC